MKKLVSALLALVLVLSLSACGSKNDSAPADTADEPEDAAPAQEQTEPEPEENPDPYEMIGDYVGIYHITEITSEDDDLTDFYAEHWEDKSIYMFIYINDQCEFKEYMYRNSNGEDQLDEITKLYFNPINKCVYTNKQQMEFGTKAGAPLSIENGVITIDTDTSHQVFEWTDEIPFPEG